MVIAWVGRAGVAFATTLMDGYRLHLGAPGLAGRSVQYEPGQSVDELACAGQFKNKRISVAAEGDLVVSLQPLDYAMHLVPSPDKGHNHTLVVLYDASGRMLQRLSQDAADALRQTFQQRPNPHPFP
jgi:hypothetical protein